MAPFCTFWLVPAASHDSPAAYLRRPSEVERKARFCARKIRGLSQKHSKAQLCRARLIDCVLLRLILDVVVETEQVRRVLSEALELRLDRVFAVALNDERAGTQAGTLKPGFG